MFDAQLLARSPELFPTRDARDSSRFSSSNAVAGRVAWPAPLRPTDRWKLGLSEAAMSIWAVYIAGMPQRSPAGDLGGRRCQRPIRHRRACLGDVDQEGAARPIIEMAVNLPQP